LGVFKPARGVVDPSLKTSFDSYDVYYVK